MVPISSASHSFVLGAPLTARVRQLAAEQAVSLDETLLAAFAVLLHRHSGQELPADLTGNPSFVALLERVRRDALAAAPARSGLTLAIEARQSELAGRFEYAAARSTRPTIEQMAAQLDRLLAAVVEEPGRPLSQLPLLTERSGASCSWSGTRRRRSSHGGVHPRAVRGAGAADARRDGGRVGRGAADLSASSTSAPTGSRITCGRSASAPTCASALCVERSPELVVAVLAIAQGGRRVRAARSELSGGAARVHARRRAGARCCSTQAAARARLIDGALATSSRRRRRQSAGDGGASGLRDLHLGLDGAAQGRRGAASRASSDLVSNAGVRRASAPTSACCCIAPLAFDAVDARAVGAAAGRRAARGLRRRETALDRRASCARCSRDQRRDDAVADVPRSSARSSTSGPRRWRRPKRSFWPAARRSRPSTCGACCEHGPDRALINVYGPTESTTFACCHQYATRRDGRASVPIGRPIANTARLRARRAALQPVPIGVRRRALHRRRRAGARLPEPRRR